MKKPLLFSLIGVFLIATGVASYFYIGSNSQSFSFISPVAKQIQEKVKPLEKYTFDNLRDIETEESEIALEEVIEEEDEFTSHLFSFTSEGKKITGQLNLPNGAPPKAGFPVILMLRGYIDPDLYQTGAGTRRSAAVYARNGFITIAPDFLGHGGSDDPDENTIAARLKRPYNLLTLINSLSDIPEANHQQLAIWGHSNGGQIALTLLQIIDRSPPTTLWAPVSKPFPYSILYYTDESDDRGKALRKVIAQFEEDYDVDNYSIHGYYDRINSPIQIHQGTIDDSVPREWSDELVEELEELEKDVTYFVYPGADHNLQPSWNTVVQRDIAFFRNELNKK